MLANSNSCYIVGETTLVIYCAEILLQRGFSIAGVISSAPAVKDWAIKHHLSFFDSLTQAEPILLNASFDYLFSITNKQILTAALLKKPNQFTINYHDSPLPRYAGVNVTSWALLNDEKSYGMTWHVINDVIDGGDILKQVLFDISPSETAFSLNFKCYQHGIKSFAELADELVQQTYIRQPQDLSQRTYYKSIQKPVNDGLIDWHHSVEEIDKLCRALYVGSYLNTFCSATFLLGGDRFVLAKMHVTDKVCHATPGTLIGLNQQGWHIATANKVIVIQQINDLKGQTQSLKNLAERYQLASGQLLFDHSQI